MSVFCRIFVMMLAAAPPGATDNKEDPRRWTREQVIERTMAPYAGESKPGVDRSTLTGKVMCGYQGWFAAEGDGCGRGFYHWYHGPKPFGPGNCKVDLWPDVSDLGPDERYATPFRRADGSVAEVFSAFNAKTVARHFKWMQESGIDGVFVQRFITEVQHPLGLRQFTTVLGNCRAGANQCGRTYAVMYDLSGLKSGQIQKVMDDWKLLADRMQITKDPAYQFHRGRPVVAVWGFGFKDRAVTPAEGIELVKFLKDDPRCGGNTVMLGVPTNWRTLHGDCIDDPKMHELIAMADIVSPWSVGRYHTPEQAKRHAEKVLNEDIAWCAPRKIDFMPVVFPGFSWHNMFPDSPLDQIPRLKGKFLWSQYVADKQAGATMIYQAMFDEVDEGTAIFKCTNEPPTGASRFVTYEGLPPDFYLKLVGQGARLLRGEIPATADLPQ